MDLKALRILVVDDNRHAAEIVKSILGSVGAQDIRYATTAHAAFELMRGEVFDLIVVDQNLGKGDEGIQLCRDVLKANPGSLTAKLGAEWLLSQQMPLWHVPMMNEEERNRPYFDALKSVVSKCTLTSRPLGDSLDDAFESDRERDRIILAER